MKTNTVHDCLEKIENILKLNIEAGMFPGACVAIVLPENEIFNVVAGNFTYYSGSPKINLDTIFDIASFSKVFSATAVMHLQEQGLLNVDDFIGKYISGFNTNGKQQITLRHLLTHTAGFGSLDKKNVSEMRTKGELINEIANFDLIFQPSFGYRYSDLGFILLGEVMEHITGKTLDKLIGELILNPLNMRSTLYNPSANFLERIAPTEQNHSGEYLHGIVHDEKARLLGGIAGHSGLFSTYGDLVKFLSIYLDILGGSKNSILLPETVQAMVSPQIPEINTSQGIAWFLNLPYMGKLAKITTFGHTGFTGVSALVDIPRRIICLLLTNAVHPIRPDDQKRGKLQTVRAEIANLALELFEATR